MLLEYRVSNYRSFKDEAYLDMRPAKTKVINRYRDNYVIQSSGEKVLKDAVIVGENAGGKSNLVESLKIFRDMLVRMDIKCHSYRNTVNSSNVVYEDGDARKVDVGKSISEQAFSMDIALDECTYTYRLRIDWLGVVGEELSVRLKRKGASQPIFTIERLPVQACDGCDGFEGCKNFDFAYHLPDGPLGLREMKHLFDNQYKCDRPALLWFSTLGEGHCRRVINWIIDRLVIAFSSYDGALEKRLSVDGLLGIMRTQEYLEIVKLIDSSIVDISLDCEHPLRESILVRRNAAGKRFERSVKDDSAGVRQFLCWAVYVYEVVYRNKTVVADEIDSLINPVLSDRVIAFINGSEHHGQLFFTTHNIFNLTLRTYMKEQIYFVTKDAETLESTLYSAADFDEIRYDVKEELYEFYLKGMLGGTVNA